MSLIATYIVPHPPIILPEIGRGEEQVTNKTLSAYRQIAKEIKEIKPDTIIVSSPHANAYRDYFHIASSEMLTGDFSHFGVYGLKMSLNCDTELVSQIEEKSKLLDFPMGTLGSSKSLDHGVMVPLYFINKEYKDYKLLVISPSGLSQLMHYQAGKIIQSILPKEQKVVWIASGDLSHKLKADGPYGYEPKGPIFDEEITAALSIGDFLYLLRLENYYCEKVAECGVGSFTMMAGVLDGYQVSPKLLSYEGPFGVGYAVIQYNNLTIDSTRHFDERYEEEQTQKTKNSRSSSDPYITLARKALEYYILKKKRYPITEEVPVELRENKAGVFVSIHKGKALRGCIGTLLPTTETIAEEILSNAISAGTRDYRFSPVKKKELNDLVYKVDVLLPPEEVFSMDDLDVKKYGVIVSYGYKKGVLLPNLEGIDTIEEQLSIVLQKAGISEFDDYKIERFEVIRHE